MNGIVPKFIFWFCWLHSSCRCYYPGSLSKECNKTLCSIFAVFRKFRSSWNLKKKFFFFCRDIWQQTGCLFWIVFLRTSILLPGHSTCSSVVFLYDLGHVTIFSGPPFPRLYKGMTIFYLCPSSRLAQVVHGGTSLYLGTYVVLFNLR